MGKGKNTQELNKNNKPEEKKTVTFADLNAEEKAKAKEAILQEMKDTNIVPSNPDSPHVADLLKPEGLQLNEGEYVETYHWVKFHQRSNPIDELKVKLTVNGELLVIARGIAIPLPHRYLEAADHTTHEEFAQEPGKTRKIVTEVCTFPYELIKDATKEEFESFRDAGTRATKEQLVKDGTISEREAGMI
jgi:hypothetical protein